MTGADVGSRHWGAVESGTPLPGMKDSGLMTQHTAGNTHPVEIIHLSPWQTDFAN